MAPESDSASSPEHAYSNLRNTFEGKGKVSGLTFQIAVGSLALYEVHCQNLA
jgi:hypothetical protein